MKKLEYLKLAFNQKLFHRRAWIITVFSVTREVANPEVYPLRLLPRPWGFAYFDAEGVEQKIEDSKPNEPLFRFSDRINIDPSWVENLSAPVETSVGNLLYNHFCIVPAFGKKFPFITGRTSVEDAETAIAAKFKSTPKNETDRSTEYFYADEYIRYVNSLQDFSSLSQLCAWSATPKGILPPKGVVNFKKQLLQKYEGKLEDPVEVSKFEGELLEFDDNWLKGDPAYGTFLKGKVKNISRKKLFLTMGNESGFDSGLKATTVVNSLHEGWPTDPKQFAIMMNGARVASYYRGAETVKGGVSAKYLLRAANNFKIVDTDCGTKFGIERQYDAASIEALINRRIIDKGSVLLIENKEQAGNYLGKKLLVRSPAFCKMAGDNICRICAGESLAKYPTGLTIPLTEISAAILTASLKAMHVSGTSTAKMNLAECIS